jgi:hypothetical protein
MGNPGEVVRYDVASRDLRFFKAFCQVPASPNVIAATLRSIRASIGRKAPPWPAKSYATSDGCSTFQGDVENQSNREGGVDPNRVGWTSK